MNKSTILYATLLCMASTPLPAGVMLGTISGNWTSPVGGAYVTITPGATSTDPDRIFWGDPVTAGQQSGYIWDAVTTPLEVSPGPTPFLLGEFTHVNRPIWSGTSLSSVALDFQVGDFDSPLQLSAALRFDHNETPNSGADPRDIVTVSNAFFNTPFTEDGVNYYFTLLGFSTDGGNTITSQYYTEEDFSNTAGLYAIITTTPVVIPEPASLLLLGTGLGTLGWARRRRSKA